MTLRSVPTLFFLIGALFALAGMLWGIRMSAAHNHALAPAHGHLNLVGFVSMSIFGTYYALSPAAAQSVLARVHLGLAILAVLVLIPGIVLAIRSNSEAVAKAGSALALLSMALFAVVILRHGIRDQAPE